MEGEKLGFFVFCFLFFTAEVKKVIIHKEREEEEETRAPPLSRSGAH